MNARLEYDTGFLAAIYWEDRVLFNHYHVKIEMQTVSMDHVCHNVALERVRYIINEMMANSIFVHQDDRSAIKKLESAGLKVILLPEIPVDQIVGMMLYCKLSAVVEDQMDVTQIGISSDLGEGVVYLQDQYENVGPFESNGWWADPEPKSQGSTGPGGKVVKLEKSLTWKDLDLSWPDEDPNDSDDPDKNVVEFRKDETK